MSLKKIEITVVVTGEEMARLLEAAAFARIAPHQIAEIGVRARVDSILEDKADTAAGGD